MAGLFDKLRTMLEADGRAVLVSVAEVRGSAPRNVGAAMAVAADGAFSGTIGGGALEWQALAQAQALLARPAQKTLKTVRKSLGPDLGQCCGGQVTLVLERLGIEDSGWVAALAVAQVSAVIGTPTATGHFARRPATEEEAVLLPAHETRRLLQDGRLIERFSARPSQVLLFGAGHVGRAIALAMAPLPFRLAWIDPRPDAFPRFIPQNADPIVETDPASRISAMARGGIVLVMTHSHALDLDIARAALLSERAALVGVIGSATKRARFASQLRRAGLADAVIARLVCPIGLPGIHGKEPATIAASVAAQCLMIQAGVAATALENPYPSDLVSSQGQSDRL